MALWSVSSQAINTSTVQCQKNGDDDEGFSFQNITFFMITQQMQESKRQDCELEMRQKEIGLQWEEMSLWCQMMQMVMMKKMSSEETKKK